MILVQPGNTATSFNIGKDHIGEDGTAGCLACNKYAVLPPYGRHGRLPASLTVSIKQCEKLI